MKKIVLYFVFVVCLMAQKENSWAQFKQESDLQNKIEQYTSNHLQEKLYLHTDKSTYFNNELCWFKIYSVDALFNFPLNISSVAYVEMLNASNEPVIQEKVALEKGTGNGSFSILNNLPSGDYTIRAYTNWMKNFNPNYFFSKQIKLINTQIPADSIINKATKYTIHFFPEGGSLINGLQTKVGFKLTNQLGKGTAAKGWILNELNDTITNFSCLSNGIGNFTVAPNNTHQYSAIVTTNDGANIVEKLPSIQNNGYRIQLQNKVTDSYVQIQVQNNQSLNEAFYLLIHTRGIVKKIWSSNFQNGLFEIRVDKKDLGEGVNTITLFNSNKTPVSERLYFIYPKPNDNQLSLTIESNKYKNRQKVNLSLNATEKEIASGLDMSMSVYKLDALQSIDEMNIQNYVWLQSDLAENVQSPNNYFDTTNENRFEEMDNLMLTNGWRRFSWEKVMANTIPTFSFLPELAGSIISGKIVQRSTELAMNESTGYVSMPSKYTQFKSAISDQNGLIQFEFGRLTNDGQVIVQADSSKNYRNKIVLDNPFYIGTNTSQQVQSLTVKSNVSDLNNYYRNIQIQNYYSPNSNNQFTPLNNDSIPFYGQADRSYLLDNYARFTTLEEVIREYVTPLSLFKSNGKFKLRVYDDAGKRFFDGEPLLLLDGVVIKDIDKFIEYDPLKIRKLDVVSRLYYLGNLAYNGIINFTTYNGKMEAYELDPNSVVLDYKGLQAQRIFAAPSYDTQYQIDNRLPDFRHLLYWNPAISLNEKQVQKLHFYTSDLNGKYVIILQGINKIGTPIYKELSFTVQP